MSEHTVNDSGCWIWAGAVDANGYGRAGSEYAHRLAFTQRHGPVPIGHVIDHMCRVTQCVNPDHLQAVTHKQNLENLGLSRANTSGIRGVSWDRRTKSWIAGVKHNYVRHHVGRFKSLAEAETAVVRKRNDLFSNNLADVDSATVADPQ